jgi:hypothetical protein
VGGMPSPLSPSRKREGEELLLRFTRGGALARLPRGYRRGPLRGPWFGALRAGGGRIIEDGLGTLLKQGVNERSTALKTGNSKLESFGYAGPISDL